MTREEFKELARIRLLEAAALNAAGHCRGAYYLAGYSVECGLKACIARLMKRNEFPDKNFAVSVYTHDLDRLVDLARLRQHHDLQISSSQVFKDRWSVVKDWRETSRYDLTVTQAQANDMLKAVSARKLGVLTWLKQHW